MFKVQQLLFGNPGCLKPSNTFHVPKISVCRHTHGDQDALPSFRKYSKGFFYNSSGSGEMVNVPESARTYSLIILSTDRPNEMVYICCLQLFSLVFDKFD